MKAGVRHGTQLRRGNCLFWAVILMWWLKSWDLRIAAWGGWCPHFMVVEGSGRAWHFEYVRKVKPCGLGVVWFVGQIVPLLADYSLSECDPK